MTRDSQSLRDEREREFFAKHYEAVDYNLTAWRLRMERELRNLTRVKGGRLGRLLSVGCGDGRFELMLAEHADHVTALDISPEGIEVAKRLATDEGVENIEFICTSALEFQTDERFDTVICIAFIHHLPEGEVPGFFRWMSERLAPNGLLYTQDPNVHGVLRAIGRVVLGARYHDYHSPDERELDPAEVRSAMRAAGLSDIRTRGIDLTILPLGYMFPRAPAAPMNLLAAIDRIWCATPLERWASGFAAHARRPDRAAR